VTANCTALPTEIDAVKGLTATELSVLVATVKFDPELATPFAVTTTLPVVAPVGTGTVIELAPQLVGVATVPLKVTVLVP
jgi:hypothetical protein